MRVLFLSHMRTFLNRCVHMCVRVFACTHECMCARSLALCLCLHQYLCDACSIAPSQLASQPHTTSRLPVPVKESVSSFHRRSSRYRILPLRQLKHKRKRARVRERACVCSRGCVFTRVWC